MGNLLGWVIFRNDNILQAAGGQYIDTTEVILRLFLLKDNLGPRLRFCAQFVTGSGGSNPSQGNERLETYFDIRLDTLRKLELLRADKLDDELPHSLTIHDPAFSEKGVIAGSGA